MKNKWVLILSFFLAVCCSEKVFAYNAGAYDNHHGTPIGGGDNSPEEDNPEGPNPTDKDDPRGESDDPVYLATGKFYLELIDYKLPGPMPIQIKRRYATQHTYNGPLGYGWAMTHNERLYRLKDGSLLLRRGDTTKDQFTANGDDTYSPLLDVYEHITQLQDGSYKLLQGDGIQKTFNYNGTLATIEQPAGAALHFTYSTNSLPISGISAYSHYTNPIVVARDYRMTRIEQAKDSVLLSRYATFLYNESGRITNITFHAGGTQIAEVSYHYDTEGTGDLVSFTDVGGIPFAYSYDDQHRMTHYHYQDRPGLLRINTFDEQNHVIQQDIGNMRLIYEYTNGYTRLTTKIYNEQTGAFIRDRVEHYYFTSTDKTEKYIVEMGAGLDEITGESDDLVSEYTYDPVTDDPITWHEAGRPLLTHTYDENGNIQTAQFTDPNGEIYTVYTDYDHQGHITNRWHSSSFYPGVKLDHWIAIYNGDHRIETETQIGTNGIERLTFYSYQTNGLHLTVTRTDSEMNRISREYGPYNNLLRKYDPDHLAYEISHQYDEIGRVTNRLDARGQTWHYAYNVYNLPILEINPLGETNRYEYTGKRLDAIELSSVSGQPGYTTRLDYDPQQRLTSISRINDNDLGQTNRWTAFTYDSGGNILSKSNALFQSVAYEYDRAGRIHVIENPYGGHLTNTYDKAGQLIAFTEVNGTQTRMAYDGMGRITSTINGYGNPHAFTNHYERHPFGLAVQRWPDGLSSTNHYDEFGRLASVSGARQQPVTRHYDSLDRLTEIIDGLSHIVSNRYNPYHDLTQVIYQDGSGFSNRFDFAGLILEQLDGNSNRFYMTYDDAGQRLTLSESNDSNTVMVATTYHPSGLPQTIADSSSSLSNTYDRLNRLISQTHSTSNVPPSTIFYGYNELDHLTNSILTLNNPTTNNLTTFYSYDNGGRLSAIQSKHPGSTQAFHYASVPQENRLAGITNQQSGIVTAYGYDPFNRVTNITYRASDDTLIHAVDYAYDTIGMITNVVINDGSQGSVKGYQYDSINRLISESSALSVIQYSYDLAGNRTSVIIDNATTNTYQLGIGNRLDRVTTEGIETQSFSYDNAGNTISISNDTHQLALDWDPRHRLTTVTLNNPTTNNLTTFYSYDVLGRRISVFDGSNTIHMIYDGNQVVAELDQNGDLLRTYTYGPGIDNILSITVYTNTPIPQNAQTYYYIKDIQNTVLALTDETGAIVESYDYDAWGNILDVKNGSGTSISNQQSAIGNRYLFQGREYDFQTGLYYFRARWYHSQTGRWLSKDPIGISGGLNQYSFVANDPVNFVDPYGLLENYLSNSWDQFWKGNYSGNVTLLGTAGQIGTGLLGIDLPGDIRDLFYDISNWEWSWGHAGQTALDAVALLPVIGALKYADEGATLLKHSDDIKVIGRLEDTSVAKNWTGHDVLDVPDWTLQKNMDWVDDGIKNNQPFYTASPEAGNLIQSSGPYKGTPTIYSMEVQRLLDAGYQKVGDYYLPPTN